MLTTNWCSSTVLAIQKSLPAPDQPAPLPLPHLLHSLLRDTRDRSSRNLTGEGQRLPQPNPPVPTAPPLPPHGEPRGGREGRKALCRDTGHGIRENGLGTGCLRNEARGAPCPGAAVSRRRPPAGGGAGPVMRHGAVTPSLLHRSAEGSGVPLPPPAPLHPPLARHRPGCGGEGTDRAQPGPGPGPGRTPPGSCPRTEQARGSPGGPGAARPARGATEHRPRRLPAAGGRRGAASGPRRGPAAGAEPPGPAPGPAPGPGRRHSRRPRRG